MNLKTFIDNINKIEKSIDISNLNVFNFNVWPLLRRNIFAKYNQQFQINPNKLIKIGYLTKVKTILICTQNYLKNPIKKDNIDILYFTRSSELIDIGNDILYNKYSDPLIEFFGDKYKIKVLETQDSYIKKDKAYNNNKTTNIFIKTLFIRVKTAIKLKIKNTFQNKNLNEKIEEIFDFKIDLNKDILLINELSKYFDKILKSYSPKIVMLACFYRPEAMAMTLACKKLGIKVVEYQHGAQNDIHFMYTNWHNITGKGYDLLPDIFWTWGSVSAKRIDTWANKTTRHKTIVGGNLWLSHKRIEYQKKEEFQTNDNKYNILLSLQGDERFPDFLIKYIENEGKKYSWYFRDHPRFSISNKLKKKLNEITGTSIKQTSDQDLFTLLKKMDLHLTGYSTVAFEAQSFGVPTIFTHINARNGYWEILNKNGLYFADNSKDFHEKINFIKNNREEIKPDYIISDIKVAEKALEELIGQKLENENK
jgi:hypothetical protein